jgi:hypothetical protein
VLNDAASVPRDAPEKVYRSVSTWAVATTRGNRRGKLSGGQWQRITATRGFHRGNHAGLELLIMDEPSSALDPRAEDRLIHAVRERQGTATTILITHALANLVHADRIYVMRDGALVEQGTHAEFVAAGRRYADLYAMQAADYPRHRPAGNGDVMTGPTPAPKELLIAAFSRDRAAWIATAEAAVRGLPFVACAWLCGSLGRGGGDGFSDVDLVVAADQGTPSTVDPYQGLRLPGPVLHSRPKPHNVFRTIEVHRYTARCGGRPGDRGRLVQH